MHIETVSAPPPVAAWHGAGMGVEVTMDEAKDEVLDEAVTKPASKWALYNRLDALLPLFGLKKIPLYKDGHELEGFFVVNGEEVWGQETRPIDLTPRDFLVMRAIAKHENADVLELINTGKLEESDPAAIVAWTWISEDEIGRECGGISRSSVARTMESCGPAKVADVSPRRKVGTEQRQVGQGFIDILDRGVDSNGHQLSKYRRINRKFLSMMETYLPHYLKATKRTSPDLETHEKYRDKIKLLLLKQGRSEGD